MKKPIYFITLPTISFCSFLLSEYMGINHIREMFFDLLSDKSQILFVVFSGFSRISHLFFGVFLYYINFEIQISDFVEKKAIGYFSFFSLTLCFLTGTFYSTNPIFALIFGVLFLFLIYVFIKFSLEKCWKYIFLLFPILLTVLVYIFLSVAFLMQ